MREQVRDLTEAKKDIYSICRITNAGDFSSDKKEIGTIEGDINQLKKDIQKKYGKIVKIDKSKKEIIVESVLRDTRKSSTESILESLKTQPIDEVTGGRAVIPFETSEVYHKDKAIRAIADEVNAWTKKHIYKASESEPVEVSLKDEYRAYAYMSTLRYHGSNVECLELAVITPYNDKGDRYCLKRFTVYPDGKTKQKPVIFKDCTEEEILDAIL